LAAENLFKALPQQAAGSVNPMVSDLNRVFGDYASLAVH
jgi:hypothetical protein